MSDGGAVDTRRDPAEEYSRIDPTAPLSPRDSRVIELYLTGMTRAEISKFLLIPSRDITQILDHPDAKSYISARTESMRREFGNLFPKVITTLSEGMDPDKPMEIRLAAADKWLRAQARTGLLGKDEKTTLSAEDVVAEILRQGELSLNIKKKPPMIDYTEMDDAT